MIYFKPLKKGTKVDLGQKRIISMNRFDVLEIDDDAFIARVRASTGALMKYFGDGNIKIAPRVILKLMSMTDKFELRTEYKFEPLK